MHDTALRGWTARQAQQLGFVGGRHEPIRPHTHIHRPNRVGGVDIIFIPFLEMRAVDRETFI